MKKLWNLLLITIFLAGCFQKKEIPIQPIDSRPVVNCLFNDDSIFVVNVSYLTPINDNFYGWVDNAIVKLINSQNEEILEYLGNGIYISSMQPVQGSAYNLKVEINGFDTLEAISYVPDQVDLLSVDQEDFSIPIPQSDVSDEYHLPYSRISFTFRDKEGEKNYYEIQVFLNYYEDTYIQTTLYSFDSTIQREDILDYEPKTLVFSDSLLDGDTITVNVLYRPNWVMYDGYSFTYGSYKIKYRFRSISQQMYLFKKSLIKHLYNQQTDYIEAFGDPVQVYSNVKNGLGIFAGYTQIEDTIRVEASYFTP